MNNTTTRRNAHFMAAVNKTVAEWGGKTFSLNNILAKVIDSPAPEFYVTYDTAYRYVSLAMNGNLPNTEKGTRRRQWLDLASRVKATMRRHPHLSRAKALQLVLEHGQAPSFYLSLTSAATLYYSIRSSRRQQRINTMRRRHQNDQTH